MDSIGTVSRLNKLFFFLFIDSSCRHNVCLCVGTLVVCLFVAIRFVDGDGVPSFVRQFFVHYLFFVL